MVRVVIYEDNVLDVINRYHPLVAEHDVYVRLIFQERVDDRLRNSQVNYLVKKGFGGENVGFELDILPDVDIFFVDGLRGHWKNVIDKLPREKSFLNTYDFNYKNLARSEGYLVLDESPLEAINRVLKNS